MHVLFFSILFDDLLVHVLALVVHEDEGVERAPGIRISMTMIINMIIVITIVMMMIIIVICIVIIIIIIVILL